LTVKGNKLTLDYGCHLKKKRKLLTKKNKSEDQYLRKEDLSESIMKELQNNLQNVCTGATHVKN